MEQEREVQPQVCNAETRERASPGQTVGFLWVIKRLYTNLVQPLKGNWLKEVPHHLPLLSK